ncbi:MAG TPA: hypothetical protein VN800_05305, partial [Candidatus Acidoferrales bacterium]|nr:hypothetical protein [Candidatus Acidoferrales bacterium]
MTHAEHDLPWHAGATVRYACYGLRDTWGSGGPPGTRERAMSDALGRVVALGRTASDRALLDH